MTRLSIILPVHNEEDIIETTFEEIYDKITNVEKSVEFILVENGSTDKTLQIAKKIAAKHKSTKWTTSPKGYGSAILKGIKIANGKYVCYMPSDGQVDMNVFRSIWEDAQKEKWQIVKAKRKNRESFARTLVSKVFCQTISLLFNTPKIDVNGSPRIIRKDHLNSLKLVSGDSFIDAEMVIKASKLNWKIKETEMPNLDRAGGKSTRSYKTFLEFFNNIFLYKLSKN